MRYGLLAILRRRYIQGPLLVAASTAAFVSVGGKAVATPEKPHPAPSVKQAPAVKGVKAVTPRFTEPDKGPANFRPRETAWPTAGTTTIALAEPAAATARARQSAGSRSPVWARALDQDKNRPEKLTVSVLDPAAATKAGVAGVLLTVAGDRAGRARVGLDYAGFAEAYGGNYALRLKLWQYPACFLTTPDQAACRQGTPLKTENDTTARTLSAAVDVPATTSSAMVLAAAADGGAEGGGDGGTYEATTLKPSGSWSGGSSTGNFTYSYPISIASAPSEMIPSLGLSYDSSATDGQTAATQAQASWVGEGWNTPNSFIEQSFQSCSEKPGGKEAPTKIYDSCYDGPIFTLSLNGSSTPLVWDSTAKVFKPEKANGAVVTHYCTKTTDPTCTLKSEGNGSSAYAQDWWQVTDRDGTTYSFGMNRLPGWTDGKAVTNSVATIPVYSPHSGDPCYKSSGFADSVCTMAYRWGMDYAVDTHGNAVSYHYKQDTNYYGKHKADSMVSYVRDQHLTRIDYGFTDGNAYGTIPARIVLNTGERCVSGTCTLNATNAKNYPDVPFDLVCASGAKCKAWSPSFFSTVRLTGIVAQQYQVSTSSYVTVDSYALTQTMPATGDGTAATLWLSQIVHTGAALAGGATASLSAPPITFTPIQLQNRVDTATDGLPAFYKYRIDKITTETGSEIGVSYDLIDPCTAPVKVTASSNTTSCYPVSWTPDGYTAPIKDWFNKYVVTKVVQTDPTGGASAQTTVYKYLGGAAWRYDENELVKEKHRTYGQFRGYAEVETYLGDGVNDRQSKSKTAFYRGMSKNNNSTVVELTDSLGGKHEDVEQLAGMTLETSGYLGDAVDNSVITSYWVSANAASRSRTGLPALTSNWVAPVQTYTRQAVSSGWRYSQTDTSYFSSPSDTYFGLPKHVYTHTSPVDKTFDTCETTTYAPANTKKNIVGLVAETEKVSVACGGFTAGAKPSAPGSVNTLTAPASVSRPAQVMSASRTFYDDTKWSTTFPQADAPAKGDVTMVRKAADHKSGAYVWETSERSAYDSVGRQTETYDGNGNVTRTAHTVNSVGLITATDVTNALGQSAKSTIEPQRGNTLTATDANGVVTTQQYDAMGRVTSVWFASRATTLPANKKFTYQVSNTGPTATTTQVLNDNNGYQTSTLIYDGLMRSRQTQAMTPQGGRVVTDTFYDSRGWVTSSFDKWWDSKTTPNTTLVSAADLKAQVPKATATTYNSLGDPVIEHNMKNGLEVSRVVTIDQGDRTFTIPPLGGTVTASITDAGGRGTQAVSYLTRPTVTEPADAFTGRFTVTGGTTSVISYGFDGHGNRNVVRQGAADGNGPAWTETYDLLGRVTDKVDPDAGPSTDLTYDGAGNLLEATDARGQKVSYKYDALNRKIGKYASAVTAQTAGPAGNQMAGWVYDNANGVAGVTRAIGLLTTETAYIDGAAWTKQQLNFNVFGDSLGVSMTVPSTAGALAGTYTVRQTYSATTGLALRDVYNAQGGLPSETVNRTYQGVLDLPDTINGLTGYGQGTTYDAYGNVLQQTLGMGTNLAYVTNAFDLNSGRQTGQLVTRTNGATVNVDEQVYRYDLAGNILAQVSKRLGAATPTETQCFDYDGLTQLTGAWTATDDCKVKPSPGASGMVGSSLGAASAYWTDWSVDILGNRTAETRRAFTGGPAADVTTSYGYSTSQPHALTSTTGGAAATSYGYDASGNMTSRKAAQGSQTLNYNAANQLTTVTGSTGGNSSYGYDATGGVMMQKDPAKTVIYIGNQQFTHTTATGAVTGVRYYQLPGGGQVVRTGTTATDFVYAIADHHDTPVLYLDNTAQKPNWRQYTPYGEERGAAVVTPDNRGFLNKPKDTTTGLTLVGSRQYDAATGRFITADPLLEKEDPTQLGGYAYAANNPMSKSDPSGQRVDDSDGSSGSWRPFSFFYGFNVFMPSFYHTAQQEVIKKAKAGYTNPQTKKRSSYGGGKTVSGVFNRHTGETTVRVNGENGCAERMCRPGYATYRGDLYLSAVSTKKRGNSGHVGTDDFGKDLYEKPVCWGNCQTEITKFADKMEVSAGSLYAPGTALYNEHDNGHTRTSPYTRAGTSILEARYDGTKAGSLLSAANGRMEGLSRSKSIGGKVFKAAGPVGMAAGVAFDVYDVATAPPGKKMRAASVAVGGIALGAAAGAVGAIVGGPVGAVVLGAAGNWAGRKVGGFIADLF